MKEKLFLGISLGFNSSACLYSSTKGLLKCISEERINRIKNTKEIPIDAIKYCLKDIDKINDICISHYENITYEYFNRYSNLDFTDLSWKECVDKIMKLLDVTYDDIYRIDHHMAHAYSPFGFYPIEDHYYLISSDGFGDGYSAQILDEEETIIDAKKLNQSIGLIYQFVTGALGFKEHEHEGKITGLAAHGKPIYLDDLCSLYDVTDKTNIKYIGEVTDEDYNTPSQIIDFADFLSIKRNIYKLIKDLIANGAEMKDIACSVQEFAEVFTIAWLKSRCLIKKSVYLSGGLFANVKLNQRIKDSGIFENVYVCPAMGDEGTCVGACIAYSHLKIDGKFLNVFGGLSPKNYDQYEYHYDDKLIDIIIDDIINNKVVCLVRGNMEFGPRALCHRTILCDATDPTINDTLNHRLGRTEFMPFAPVCAEEFANDLFKNFKHGEYASKFMTMTFDGTDEFVTIYKGVAHVDGTARPQCVNKKEMPFMHRLLMRYYSRTGKKCLINTSYNLHGEPIIDNSSNAIKSFIIGKLDTLIINNGVYYEIK